MNIEGISIPDLNEIEKCYALETINTKDVRVIKVYVPKLMAINNNNELVNQNYYLNIGRILNIRSSLPQELVPNLILKNYLDVELSKKAYINTIINKGDELTLLCKNKDITDLLIVEL